MLPTDWRLTTIREHPLVKHHREKVVVYDERDRPWCAFPGVYVSMPSTDFDRRAQKSWGYFRLPQTIVPREDPDLLFSFIGSPSDRTRQMLFQLHHPRRLSRRCAALHFSIRRPTFRGTSDTIQRDRWALALRSLPARKGNINFRIFEALSRGARPGDHRRRVDTSGGTDLGELQHPVAREKAEGIDRDTRGA